MKQVSLIKVLILILVGWNIYLQIQVNDIKQQLETAEPDETIVLEQVPLGG